MSQGLRVVVLISGVAIVPPVAAQETGGAATPVAQPRFATEVVVTPERGETPRAQVPAATAVLEQRDIEMSPVAHPGELTAYLPGFLAVRPEFHAGRPVLSARGFFGGAKPSMCACSWTACRLLTPNRG